MANLTITYNPSAVSPASPWSLSGDGVGLDTNNPTAVVIKDSGTTQIKWNIQLAAGAPAGATIAFSVPPNPQTDPPTPAGIVFNSGWNGTPPNGNSNNWNTSVTLATGGANATIYYTVNAVYTLSGGTPQRVYWDPDVEENPPATIMLKTV
jgi:hypothetical protein